MGLFVSVTPWKKVAEIVKYFTEGDLSLINQNPFIGKYNGQVLALPVQKSKYFWQVKLKEGEKLN